MASKAKLIEDKEVGQGKIPKWPYPYCPACEKDNTQGNRAFIFWVDERVGKLSLLFEFCASCTIIMGENHRKRDEVFAKAEARLRNYVDSLKSKH